jgi:FMN-dependent oxidoreductase (nitrilotriacetate monooxygenase family)
VSGISRPGCGRIRAIVAIATTTLDYWVELAKLLERSKFDALFLADVLGVYDVYRGSPHAAIAIANAVQVPVNDPLLLIPAMAYVTRNLGFGVTCAVSYEHPYTLARRFSTLDHLTGGRIGWNVVTGYLNSAAKGIGLARQPEHDTRYEIAEEYMQIVYKLWEGSWEDEAVLRRRARRVFARPEQVHRIQHDGRHFQIDAIHLCEPSPQRTPLIYQAGASSRGRQFAATHAECVFINGPSKQVIAPIVADLRRRAAAAGRNPAEILIFTMMTVITAATSEAARAKLEDYRSYVSEEGALVLMSGWTGVDFSQYGFDEPIRYSRQDRSSGFWRISTLTTARKISATWVNVRDNLRKSEVRSRMSTIRPQATVGNGGSLASPLATGRSRPEAVAYPALGRGGVPGFTMAAWVASHAPECTELTVEGDRGFESCSLQRRVSREPDFVWSDTG